MNEIEKEYLRGMLIAEIEKYTKAPMKIVARCQKVIRIAKGTGLGHEFVNDLENIYVLAFKVSSEG